MSLTVGTVPTGRDISGLRVREVKSSLWATGRRKGGAEIRPQTRRALAGLTPSEAAAVGKGWQENTAAVGKSVLQKGGFAVPFFEVSTRILGRRTAPFPPFRFSYRVPHGFTPRS